MQIARDISVRAPIDKVWPFVSHIPSVTPCFPGAEVTEAVSDREFKATVKVKIGPFSPQFAGTATVEEKDDAGHKIVVRAKGADRKIGSNASALITISLTADTPETTTLHSLADFQLTGPLGQFGKGIFEGIANRMVDDFTRNINQRFG